MNGVQVDLISENRLASMTSVEKIRMILDQVKNGTILVLEKGLTPYEEAQLIETTMTEITPDDFMGIEMESYPMKKGDRKLLKLFQKSRLEPRLTVIGPANKLKTISKTDQLISTFVSMR